MKLPIYKYVLVGLSLLFILNPEARGQQSFGQYKKIEVYEVRPGFLMFPRYAADGQVCEIGLQKLLYSPGLIRVDPGISSKEIDSILNELAPAAERGKPLKSVDANLILVQGATVSTNTGYENVEIVTYSAASTSVRKNKLTTEELVATVKWKNRVCK